eukprot:5514799-Prymnesium_polylepis.2
MNAEYLPVRQTHVCRRQETADLHLRTPRQHFVVWSRGKKGNAARLVTPKRSAQLGIWRLHGFHAELPAGEAFDVAMHNADAPTLRTHLGH